MKVWNLFGEQFENAALCRRVIVLVLLWMAFRLTTWGCGFADKALGHSDLMGVAAVLGAVVGLPAGIVTLALKFYVDSRR